MKTWDEVSVTNVWRGSGFSGGGGGGGSAGSAVWGRYLDGVIGVRSRPMVWMTLRPHTHSPAQMPTPPYSKSQMGVVMLEVTLLDE